MTSNAGSNRPLPIYETEINGLRVLVIQDKESRNYSLSLALNAGMRYELEGEEGFFHLLEHMAYQDSAFTSSNQRESDLLSQGSILGGNTHMDYTEFYESGLPEYLGNSIRRVLEQVFYPAFNQNQLDQQIQAVATERANRLAQVPGGVLPWPHLTGMYWKDHANSHDGTGDLDLHQRVTSKNLAALHRRYYSVEQAVLTILSPFEPSIVLKFVQSAVEPLSLNRGSEVVPHSVARGKPINQTINKEIELKTFGPTRRISVTQGIDSQKITNEYLGSILLADLLSISKEVDVSSGVFGIADVVAEDLLVIVDDTGLALDPVDRFSSAPKASKQMVSMANERALYRVEAYIRNDQRMVRTISRDSLLRNNPQYIFDLRDSLSSLSKDLVKGKDLISNISHYLVEQPYASLTISMEEM